MGSFPSMWPQCMVSGPEALRGVVRVGALLFAAGLLLIVTGCAAPQRKPAPDGGDRNAGRVVRKVSVAGNSAFSDDAIGAGLAHRAPSGWRAKSVTYYDPLALRVDRKRVVAFYAERGYFSARVTKVDVIPVGARQIDLRFHLQEGQPVRLAGVELSGVPSSLRSAADELVAGGGFRAGAAFVHGDYTLLKGAVERLVVAHGYAHAEVVGRVEVDRDAATARVILQVDLGPLVHFGAVTVDGTRRIPARAVLDRVAWNEGDRFDPADIELTRRRLTELGAFTSVRIDYDREQSRPVVDIRIRVSEGKQNQLQLGVGFAWEPSRLELRGRAAYQRRSFVDPLTSFHSSVRPGYVVFFDDAVRNEMTVEGVVGVERIDFLWRRLRVGLSAVYEREASEAYAVSGPGARLRFDRTFWRDRVLVSAGWQLRYLIEFDETSEQVAQALAVEAPYRLGLLEQSVTLDLRDARIYPRLGLFGQLRLEEGGAFAAGAYDYVRVNAELRGYLPLGVRVVAAGRGRVGWLGFSGAEPVTQRFSSGGTGQRGFERGELAPFVSTSDGEISVGGAGLVESGAELRMRVWDLYGLPVRLIAFVDAADVQARLAQVDLGQLHWAAGVGLRLDTPIGPLRGDLGWRLNRISTPNPRAAQRLTWHISFGEAF